MRALLLSGGMDSAAVAYLTRPELAVFVDYGQVPARAERKAAEAISRSLDLELLVVQADCSSLGSGELANKKSIAVSQTPEWWPYRNQLLVTLAAAACVGRSVTEILIGTVKSDARHRDGTMSFVKAMNDLLMTQEGELSFSAPAIDISSNEVIERSNIPRSVLFWCHSCYISNTACLRCAGCLKQNYVIQNL